MYVAVVTLTIAIGAGLLMAVVMFMRRIMESTNISVIRNQIDMTADAESNHRDDTVNVAKGVEVYEIDGPFFFGMVDRFQNAITGRGKPTKVYVLNMHGMAAIDATGFHVLESFLAHRSDGYRVVLAAVPAPARRILRRMGLLRSLGEDNVCHSLEAALERAAVLAGAAR